MRGTAVRESAGGADAADVAESKEPRKSWAMGINESINDDNSLVVVLVIVLPRQSLGHRKFWSSITVNCA